MAIRATGKVSRIYTTGGRAYIRLTGIPIAPKYNYFELSMSHSNYNALYSLALVAAVNGYDLQIRTTTDIDPNVIALVQYMVVDW
jgi:hypothetical protein